MLKIENWLYANFDEVKPTTNDWMVCCPFCPDGDTKHHLGISMVKPTAHCFKCGWAGNYFTLVKEVSGADSYTEIYRQLQNPYTIKDYQTVVERLAAKKVEPKQLTEMPGWYKPFVGQLPYHAHLVLRYALKRLSMDNITRYNIGYCSDIDSPMALRLIIPIERGYYQARAIIPDARQKYINPSFPIEDRIFNFEALGQHRHVSICEGAISAIAVGQAAIATLGANGATPEQRKRLVQASYVYDYTLIVEPERVAVEQAINLADYLSGYGKRVHIRQYKMGDPADSDVYDEFVYGLSFKLMGGKV